MARRRHTKKKTPRNTTGLKIALLGLALVLGSAPLWGPSAGREIDWFTVDQVEVNGARLLPADEVIRLSGITTEQNVWDRPEGWENALISHPAIGSAEVIRKLPSTLRIQIVEERPVALLGAGELAMATETGSLLPIDPARSPVDLPILAGTLEEEEENGAATRRALAEMGRLAEMDPETFSMISEVTPVDRHAASLRMLHRNAEILMPADVSNLQLLQLRAVLSDLDRRKSDGRADGRQPVIDLRFEGQVIVRYTSRTGLS